MFANETSSVALRTKIRTKTLIKMKKISKIKTVNSFLKVVYTLLRTKAARLIYMRILKPKRNPNIEHTFKSQKEEQSKKENYRIQRGKADSTTRIKEDNQKTE
jgi:hypothetical protein